MLRNKLYRELMTISQESIYGDQFKRLMKRTSKTDDYASLVAVFINGLDAKLQEMLQISQASKPIGVRASDRWQQL